MTDNPTLFSQRQPEDQDAAPAPIVACAWGIGLRGTPGAVRAAGIRETGPDDLRLPAMKEATR